MPPRAFGDKVVSVLEDAQYAEGVAFGLKGDTESPSWRARLEP